MAVTDLARRTLNTTGTTVIAIRQKIRATAITIGQTRLAAQTALAIDADFGCIAGFTASAAIFPVFHRINTGFIAVNLPRLASNHTDAVLADFAGFTRFATVTTVHVVGAGIHTPQTSTATDGLTITAFFLLTALIAHADINLILGIHAAGHADVALDVIRTIAQKLTFGLRVIALIAAKAVTPFIGMFKPFCT